MPNNKIAWEKWEVPDQPSIESVLESIASYSQEELEELLEEGEESPNIITGKDILHQLQMISTPIGFYHPDDINRPDRQFDCWMGHTNFEITHSLKSTIEKIPGVELLSILGRYRFFVGIGRLFTFNGWNGVRFSIEKCLTADTIDEDKINKETLDIISEIKHQIQSEKHWSIFVLPNGEYDYISSNKRDDEYMEKLTLFKLTKQFTGGIIVSSEEQDERSEERGV